MFVFGLQKYDKLTTFKNKKLLGKNKNIFKLYNLFLHIKTKVKGSSIKTVSGFTLHYLMKIITGQQQKSRALYFILHEQDVKKNVVVLVCIKKMLI